MSATILLWRPKRPPVTLPEPVPLWTLHKEPWRIDCVLEADEYSGWSIRVLLNGQWFFCCRFPTSAAAIQAASDKYAELIDGGWTHAATSAGG